MAKIKNAINVYFTLPKKRERIYKPIQMAQERRLINVMPKLMPNNMLHGSDIKKDTADNKQIRFKKRCSGANPTLSPIKCLVRLVHLFLFTSP